MKSYLSVGLSGIASLALMACSETAGSSSEASVSSNFQISSVSVSPLTLNNVCKQLGGQGTAPTLTIKHSAVGGVPIKIRMWDKISNGNTYEHRRTRVMSNASGTTTVNHKFLPPCNTTGNSVSNYRFDVSASGSSTTKVWGGYDSRSKTIR